MKRFIVFFLIISMLFCTIGCSQDLASSVDAQNTNSQSNEKIVDFYAEYDGDKERHQLLFGLKDDNGASFSSDGVASITITDYADTIFFQGNLVFSADNFSEWTNSSWYSSKLLCSIYIEDSMLSKSAVNSKFLTLDITLNDGRFFNAGSVKIIHPSDGTASGRPYPDKNINGDNSSNQSDNKNNSTPTVDDPIVSSPQGGSDPVPPPLSFAEQMKKEAAACGAPYEKLGRQLVWHDEFSGSSLDYNKWVFKETMVSKGHEHVNDSRHVRVEDGNLHLQIHKSNKTGKTYSMSSGITTTDTMLFKYGYLEMRAKVPYRKGAWPSFWCTSNTPLQEAKDRMEVDIMEGWSSTNSFSSNLHKWATDGTSHAAIPSGRNWPNLTYVFKNATNLNNEYHTYGFEWDTTKMNFYVDDYKYATINISGQKNNFGTDKMPEMDMFQDWLRIIINNECFAPGDTQSSTSTVLSNSDPMPIDYYIDYVRLYQNASKGEIFKTKKEITDIVAKKQ